MPPSPSSAESRRRYLELLVELEELRTSGQLTVAREDELDRELETAWLAMDNGERQQAEIDVAGNARLQQA